MPHPRSVKGSLVPGRRRVGESPPRPGPASAVADIDSKSRIEVLVRLIRRDRRSRSWWHETG